MKMLAVLTVCCVLPAAVARSGEIIVQKIAGEVAVRQGVTETWNAVAVGDVVKPNDTMRTGRKGTAILLARMMDNMQKRIALPPDVMVDMSDIRDLTQEELMIKLTMEKVRSSSYEWKNDELRIPDATVVHGEQKGTPSLWGVEGDQGQLQWNGTRVLFENGFYSTGVLKALEVFRLFPGIASSVGNRLVFASALEKANLRGEALSEYGAITVLDGLTQEQRALIQQRMNALRER